MNVDNYNTYMGPKREKGDYGEKITAILLIKMGFTIIDRNYLIKQGEIDIIATRNDIIHFIEVKTTYGEYNPAENFHKTKLLRFLKTVRVYCYMNNINEDNVEIDLALVDMKKRMFKLVRNANIYFH